MRLERVEEGEQVEGTKYLIKVRGQWHVAEWWSDMQEWYSEVFYDPEEVTEVYRLP